MPTATGFQSTKTSSDLLLGKLMRQLRSCPPHTAVAEVSKNKTKMKEKGRAESAKCSDLLLPLWKSVYLSHAPFFLPD
jgi:hypothetical protein